MLIDDGKIMLEKVAKRSTSYLELVVKVLGNNWQYLRTEKLCTQSLQLCLTLGHPMDCTLPGSSVHSINLPRILEWAAMSSSRGSFPSRD